MKKICEFCQHEEGEMTASLFCLSVDVKYPFSFEDKGKELSINGVATPTVGAALYVYDGNLEFYVDDPRGENAEYEGYEYYEDGTLENEGTYVKVTQKINFCPVCGRKL